MSAIIQQLREWINFIFNSRIQFRATLSPDAIGIIVIAIIIWLLITLVHGFPQSKGAMLWRIVTEKIYDFFEEIMGEDENHIIKTYVVVLFFVILISNLLWLGIDLIKMPTWMWADQWFRLDTFVNIPTGNINFNLALSGLSVIIMLIVQYQSMGNIFKTLHDYIPITGKNILTIDREGKSTLLYRIAWPIIKLFDIVISLFIGFLDIVGLLAKIISLAARLAGNMFSGPLLLAMLVWALAWATAKLFGAEFPIIAVLLVYAQWLLVALIQAFVFPLLVWIFIKMARWTA